MTLVRKFPILSKLGHLAAILLILGLGSSTRGWAQPAAVGSLDGRWALQGSKTVFRFQPCGAATCGLLETSERIQANPDVRDVKNPDPQLRSRRLQGLTSLEGLAPTGAAVWRGRVYLPGSGATYGLTVTRIDADTLTAKGCAAPLLCQTSTLKRQP